MNWALFPLVLVLVILGLIAVFAFVMGVAMAVRRLLRGLFGRRG